MPEHKRPGPRTKAERGEYIHKRLSITMPWELWLLVEAERQPDETISSLIQRLLKDRVIPY
jgi:hypothetical protein